MNPETLEARIGRLERALAAFAEELRFAYRYICPDAASSLTKSRLILEKLVVQVYTAEMGRDPKKPLLGEMLADNQFTRRIARRILSRMNAIRDMGNLGPHGESVETSDAVRVLDDLCEVLDWYLHKYASQGVVAEARGEGASTSESADSHLRGIEKPGARASLTPLKYFVYVSRTKAEMLYAQVPFEHRRGLAAKLKLVLPPESGAAPISASADEALLAKTKLAVAFLEEQGLVGTVDEPNSYFRGRLDLRWGPYGRSREQLVYFGGGTEKTILGLGGSLKHVVGQVGGSGADSASGTPFLVRVLSAELGLASEELPKFLRGNGSSMALAAVKMASTQMTGPAEKIEFVARKLLGSRDPGVNYDWGSESGRQVLLGSPIYAALVDAWEDESSQ
jgi:hypothetical protein